MSDTNGCPVAWCTTDQHEYGIDDHSGGDASYDDADMGDGGVLLWAHQWVDLGDDGKAIRIALSDDGGRCQESTLGLDTAEAMFRRGLDLIAELRKV